jgi:hypothetical protein
MYTRRDYVLYRWANRATPVAGVLALGGLVATLAVGVQGHHTQAAAAAVSQAGAAAAAQHSVAGPAAVAAPAGAVLTGTNPAALPAAPITPVAKADSLVAIMPVLPAPAAGHPFAPTVLVTPVGTTASAPTGRVTLIDTATGHKCTVVLPATSCALPGAVAGSHQLQARYHGDDNFRHAIAAAVDQPLAPRAVPVAAEPRPVERTHPAQTHRQPAQHPSRPQRPHHDVAPVATGPTATPTPVGRPTTDPAAPPAAAPIGAPSAAPMEHRATPTSTPAAKPAATKPSATKPATNKPAATTTPAPATSRPAAAPAASAGSDCGALGGTKQCSEGSAHGAGAPR